MNPIRLILLICAGPVISSAATLRVGQGETYRAIQAAIDAASPGDTIAVDAGVYQENLVIAKAPLVLAGARAATDARGRVSGAPNPATESIVAPLHGKALELATGEGAIAVSGFSFVAAVEAGSGVVAADAVPLAGWVFANNHVRVAAGSAGAALWLNRNAVDATITGNVFVAAEASAQCVALAGEHAFHGLCFANNQVIREGLMGNIGLCVEGNRNLGPSVLRAPVIQGNLFLGHMVGFQGGARSLANADIADNSFAGNVTGMAAGPSSSHLHDNVWSDNAECGLRLTALGHLADAAFGARDNLIENNRFLSNGGSAAPAGYGDLCFDEQASGTQDTNVVQRNLFASAVAVFSNDPGATIHAAYNYWGAVDGPSGHAAGSGGAILGEGPVTHAPFFADAALTSLVYGAVALSGEVALQSGQSISGPVLSLAAGAILRVNQGARLEVAALTLPAGASVMIRRGSVRIGRLDMRPGAVLDVVDGNLSLDPAGDGQYHTIAGSFTFFNCLGSLQINGNTSFSGATLGLASDIHVLPGATLAVSGSLVLDGCRIESAGAFSVLVNTEANLTMVRCEVTGAEISVLGSSVELRDNQFAASSVTAFGTVNGARIFHNVFAGGLGMLNILPGAVVATQVEGWGNVGSPDLVQNELALGFRPPAGATRTLDAAGNLYVQPGDLVDVSLGICRLNVKAQAVETLLGFSTDYLTIDALLPAADWSNRLYQVSDESAVLGKVNSAVGLAFSLPDPDGTTAAGQVADLRMRAKQLEGRTRVFFRTQTAADAPLPDTRLTASAGGVPYFMAAPYTRNAATLTIDGTAPAFAAGASAVQTRNALPVDVLPDGVLTVRGTVTVTFDVVDDLAGIDPSAVSAKLTGVGGTLVGIPAGASTVVHGEVTYTRHVFTCEITGATPNGYYDVTAGAVDRSGNPATLAIGTLEVVKNRLEVTVQPQGLITTPLTREVVFTATDGTGAVLESWAVPVWFDGGTGAAVLEQVPDATMYLSAKTAWHTRVRLPVALNDQGMGTASFTGPAMLRGGDFNGDNIVNLADYNILRAVFPGVATAADITGEGYVNVGDYNILRANWLTSGESP